MESLSQILYQVCPFGMGIVMTLDELRYFFQVAEAGGMSRAAVQLSMTQPALSRQIRRLEHELRSDLFYRHGRGVTLTASGLRFLEVVAPVLDKLEKIRQEIRAESIKESGLVTLGVPPSIGATLCAPLARRFSRIYPDAKLRIHEGFSNSLCEWIENGRLDLAILYDARRRRDLLVTPIIREKLFLITAPHTSSTQDPVGWSEIGKANLILPGPQNGMRRVIEIAAREAGVTLEILLEVDSVPAIRQLVGSGAGSTILPFGAVHAEVRAGMLHSQPIAEPGMNALLVVATPKSRPVTRATRALIKLIQSEVIVCIEAGLLSGEIAPSLPEAIGEWRLGA